jgi:hypothetical protein
VHKEFQPHTVFQRLVNSVARFFTGKDYDFPKKNIHFFFTVQSGRIEKKEYSIAQFIRDVNNLRTFMANSKETLEYYNQTRNSSLTVIRELEEIISRSLLELDSLYTQATGLREWLLRKMNQKVLKRVAQKKQEEFNDLLLSINYGIIINRQNLKDFYRKYTLPDNDKKKNGGTPKTSVPS